MEDNQAYWSPGQKPGLKMEDFHQVERAGFGEGEVGQSPMMQSRFKDGKEGQIRHGTGPIVGHQQYGNWHEQNQLYQAQGPHGGGLTHGDQFMGGPFPQTASGKTRRKARPSSTTHKPRRHTKNRNAENMMAQSMGWSPSHTQPSMMGMAPPHMGMMPAPMGFAPQMFHPGPFDGAMSQMPMLPPNFSTINSEAGQMTAASSHAAETDKKNQAKIDLLEKKIRAKDLLFEDALASTVASSCACGGHGGESRTLTAELKKRFLKLKAKYKESEAEIERLSKTVKIVEVEVREDTEPFREEIQKLKDERFDLQQEIGRQSSQIADYKLKIEQFDRERNQRMLDEERSKSEVNQLHEKIRSLEEELRLKVSELDTAQGEIASFRETNSNLEIQISKLQSQLGDASLYKEWYEAKQKECDDLQKQFDEEQRKLFDKDDQIMALQDKLTIQTETNVELKEDIKRLNERVKELEDELANRPEPKDDSSSSSSEEKPDHSAELEKWKSKYEDLDRKHKNLEGIIQQRDITIENLTNDIVELRMQLQKHNITIQTNSISVSDKVEIPKASDSYSEDEESKRQVTETKSEQDESEEEQSVKSDKKKKDKKKSKDKKDKKDKKSKKDKDKKKKKKKDSSSSSGSSSSSDSESEEIKDTLQQSHSSGGAVIEEASNPRNPINPREITDQEIQQLHLQIETLRSELEFYERREEEAKKTPGILGVLKNAVNATMYKNKYEKLDARYQLNQQTYQKNFDEYIQTLTEKETQIIELTKQNQSVIESARTNFGIERIELQPIKVEYKTVQVFLDKVQIEASDKARVTVLDRERQLIKKQFDKLFKKQIQDLEANVLAYQDLLLTKEMLIKKLQREILEKGNFDQTAAQVEITSLKAILQEKMTLIENLRQNSGDGCQDHESEDELTQGTCTKTKLKRRVYKKIEHLNEYIRNEVTPEIHQKYAVEITALTEKHFNEVDRLKRDHKHEIKTFEERQEVLLSEKKIFIAEIQQTMKNQQRIIEQKDVEISNKKNLLERQALRIDTVMADADKRQRLHEGHVGRLVRQHKSQLEEIQVKHSEEMENVILKWESAEKLIDQLKKLNKISGGDSEVAVLQREVRDLKAEIARRLKVERNFEQTLYEKDSQIQELLDHKKQWNAEKFIWLEQKIESLEKQTATLKAKYKHKVIVKTQAIEAKLMQESESLRAELEYKSGLLLERESELEVIYARVEELEMMQSNNSVEVKDIIRRHKVAISQLKSEMDTKQQKYMSRIRELQENYQKRLHDIQEAFENKIQYQSEHERASLEEYNIRTERRIELIRQEHTTEIERVTIKFNLYREKLVKRETENRNLLIDLKICKDKLETIEKEHQKIIKTKDEELRRLKEEWDIERRQYLQRIETYELQITSYVTDIKNLQTEKAQLELEYETLKRSHAQCDQVKVQLEITIKQLNDEILRLKQRIVELESRPVGTTERIVEKIVYRDRPQESDGERSVEEEEEVEEQFEVLSRVKVAETRIDLNGQQAAQESKNDE